MGIFSEQILSLVIFVPLVFAVLVALLPSGEKNQLRIATLVGSLVSFGLTIWLYAAFDAAPNAPEFQFQVQKVWVPSMGIGYHVGVDGMAASLILLTGFLGPIVVVSTWSGIQTRVKEFCIALLVLQTAMYGTFAALDLLLFYVFWETLLIPMYLLIGVWGSDNRIYAALKFFLYTFTASVFMLLAIIYLYVKVGGAGGQRTFDYAAILNGIHTADISWNARLFLFLAFAVAFAVKVPMFPLHTWLPDAHVEAPAAGSIILAGVLLKMGVFGFLRYAMPFFPDAAQFFRPALSALAAIGIVYGSMMSFTQKDMKKLVAYSSVAHLGFVMLGVFALSVEATTGAVYQMLNHGISTGALFLLIGIVYERTHTRQIADYGGIAKVTPMFAAAFLVVTLSSIALPGTNGFIGEFLILTGSFNAPHHVNAQGTLPEGASLPGTNFTWLTVFAALGVILGAVYMLKMYQRVMLGPVRHPENRSLRDLTLREWATVAPLIAMALVMGILPQPFLDRIEPSTARYVARMTLGPVAVPAIGTPQGAPTVGEAAPTPMPGPQIRPMPNAPGVPGEVLRQMRPRPEGMPRQIIQPAPHQ